MSASEKLQQEMRSQSRTDVSEIILVVDTQTGKTIGQLVNISEEGFMLLGTQPISENSIFQLSLESDSSAPDARPILIGAENLWCHSSSDQTQFWAGFYIIDISDEDHERIRHLTD